MNTLLKSTAGRVVGKAYLSSDHISDATGLDPAITISKNGGAFANPNAGASVMTEIGSGWYYFALAAEDTDTLGPLIIKATHATMDPMEVQFQVVDHVMDALVADHQVAGSFGELQQDIDDEVDLIHDVAKSMAITGAALVKEAASFTITGGKGTELGGTTYVNTNIDNGVYHIIEAAFNNIDGYYEFNIGTYGVPTKVNLAGYLKEGATAGGDTIALYAYNWVGTAWELIDSAIFTGITTSGPDTVVTKSLLIRHVGTAGDVGKVRLQFVSSTLEAGTTLNIDLITVEYAESIAAAVALILGDTNELQTDLVNGGRLDLLIDAIKTKTDYLPSATAGANGGLPTTNGTKLNQTVDLTAAQSIACSDKTGFKLASDGVDAITSPGEGSALKAIKDKTDQFVFGEVGKVDANASVSMSAEDIEDISDAVVAGIVAAPEISRLNTGTGSKTHIYSVVTSTDVPIPDVRVFVYSDSTLQNLIAKGTTNNYGQITFYLDAGKYYFVNVKAGITFTNPYSETVS